MQKFYKIEPRSFLDTVIYPLSYESLVREFFKSQNIRSRIFLCRILRTPLNQEHDDIFT